LRLAEQLNMHHVCAQVACPDSQMVDLQKRATLSIAEYTHFIMPVLGRLILKLLKRDLSGKMPDLIHIQSQKRACPGHLAGAPLESTVCPDHPRLASIA